MSDRGGTSRRRGSRAPRSGPSARAGRAGRTLALAFGFALAGCTQPAAPENAVNAPDLDVQQEWNDLTGNVFWNSCTGEYVGFAEGSIQHVVVRVEDDGDGGFHVRLHRNGRNYSGPGLEWTGSEFVPTGTQYRGNSVFNQTVNVRPPFPVAFTVTSNVRVIQLGSGTNMMFHLLDHFTINANGDVTADLIDSWFVCQ